MCVYVNVSVSVRVCSEGMYFSKHTVTHTDTHTYTQVPPPVCCKRSAPFPFLRTLNQVTKRMWVSVPVCLWETYMWFHRRSDFKEESYVIRGTQSVWIWLLYFCTYKHCVNGKIALKQTNGRKKYPTGPDIPKSLIGLMTALLSSSLMAIFTAASFFSKDQYCVRFPHISTHRNVHFLKQ